MSYLSLYKLYYQNPADYEAIYQKRFTSPFTRHFPFSIPFTMAERLTMEQLCEQSGKSRMTVQKRLDALPEGILTREKNGKAWVLSVK